VAIFTTMCGTAHIQVVAPRNLVVGCSPAHMAGRRDLGLDRLRQFATKPVRGAIPTVGRGLWRMIDTWPRRSSGRDLDGARESRRSRAPGGFPSIKRDRERADPLYTWRR